MYAHRVGSGHERREAGHRLARLKRRGRRSEEALHVRRLSMPDGDENVVRLRKHLGDARLRLARDGRRCSGRAEEACHGQRRVL